MRVLALTSGPSQPEFSSFEPVGATDMVDKFSGGFAYSLPVVEVPGPNGSSYPLSLSYHSGITPEEDASWVGLGWTLNPGAVNRNTRGFPDDNYDAPIKYWNKIPKDWTVTVGANAGTEIFSGDLGTANASANATLRYNSYTGFGYNSGIGIKLGTGLGTLDMGIQKDDGRVTYPVNANLTLNGLDGKVSDKQKFLLEAFAKNLIANSGAGSFLSSSGIVSYGTEQRPGHITSYNGGKTSVEIGFTVNPLMFPAGVRFNLNGSYAYKKMIPEDDLRNFGYMYTNEADNRKRLRQSGAKDIVEDYYIEKEYPYGLRDKFIGLPFNSADVFTVSGQGLGGMFRMHHEKTGTFTPNYKKTLTHLESLGFDAGVGWTNGTGASTMVGLNTLEEGPWDMNPVNSSAFSTFSRPRDQGEGVLFRFANDPGGTFDLENPARFQYAVNNEPEAANLNPTVPEVSFAGFGFSYSNKLRSAMGQSTTSSSYDRNHKRQSYIGYHTIEEIDRGLKTRYCKRRDIDMIRNKTDVHQKSIGELSIVSQVGSRYTYALPLYSQNEKTLQYGVQGASADDITDASNFLISYKNENIKVGEERPTPYAASFLLTDITTPDYVDRTFDGPTSDDFGGYTRFGYEKTNGGDGAVTPVPDPCWAQGASSPHNWYKWRLPYNGLLYERNSLSDPQDDRGSVASGDKEIAYLKYVRTKTHTAVFCTKPRLDGLDAEEDESAAINASVHGNTSLRYLEKIQLFENDKIAFDEQTGRITAVNGEPIKTVKFSYSYELCASVPNHPQNHSLGQGEIQHGKLTLKKVWFEYPGTDPNKVSPYEFEYAYPNYVTRPYPDYVPSYNSTDQPSSYQNQFVQGYSTLPVNNQNPNYDVFNIDPWGFYQYNGKERYKHLRAWVSQKPDVGFDPAAWHLKVIKLPSKGEIHVQYEQNEYTHVQSKRAHMMIPLSGQAMGSGNIFRVNPEEVGVTAAKDVRDMADLILKTYKDKKIFFKFLYAFQGQSLPTTTSCNSDYIDGYVTLRNATAVTVPGKPDQIELQLENQANWLPSAICKEFVMTQRAGKLMAPGSCDPTTTGIADDNASAKELVRRFARWLTASPFPVSGNLCMTLNPEDSYFKLPVLIAKKGGGVRVKRLLTFAHDEAMDNEKVLYGSEYFYENSDGSSSGVATNEPSRMREQNPLVMPLEQYAQSALNRAIAGIDRTQYEGPLGESVLPAPSVGYGRVVERNINTGKSTTGFSITEFYTAKDYPVQFKHTMLRPLSRTLILPIPFFSIVEGDVSMSQGFSIILNNMHGQLHSEKTYAGRYHPGPLSATLTDKLADARMMSSRELTYFDYNRGSATTAMYLNEPEEGANGQSLTLPGRDVDFTAAQRKTQESEFTVKVEGDLHITTVGIFAIPWIVGKPSFSQTIQESLTHATTKVVRDPAIVRKVVSVQDGITHIEENLAFDYYTGQAVAVRSNDEHKGSYLKEDVLSSWVYPEHRPAAENEALVMHGVNHSIADFISIDDVSYLTSFGANSGFCGLNYLRKGDVVLAKVGISDTRLLMLGEPDYARGRIPVYGLRGEPTPPTTGTLTSIEVLTSGNHNQLAQVLGSTTYHKENTVGPGSSPLLLRSNGGVNKYGSSADPGFVEKFNNAFAIHRNNLINGSGATNFKVENNPSGFSGFDVSGFRDRLPLAMHGVTYPVIVNSLEFALFTDGAGVIKCNLVRFEINTGTAQSPVWETVQ